MRTLSLKYRIAVTIFALEAMMMAIVLWQTTSLSFNAATKQQSVQEDVTLAPIEEMSRIALLTEEYADVQAFFHKVNSRDDVLKIMLTDIDNRIVASTTATDIGQPMPPLLPQEERYWRIRMVANEAGPLGVLAMEFSHANLDAAMHHTLNMGVTLALGGMVIIAIVGLIIGHLLTRKLAMLARTATRIADGELHVVSGLTGDDELGEVGRAIDRMASAVETTIGDLKESRESFALAVSGTNDGIWDWNGISGIAQYSARWKGMLGYTDQDSEIPTTIDAWLERIHPDDRERVLHDWNNYLASRDEFFVCEHRLRRKAGDYLWVLVRGKALRDKNDGVLRMAGSLTDISIYKHQEQAMQYQALHDALTGLPNRTLFYDRVVQAIHLAERENLVFSIMMLDLDDFKQINDTLGHPIGDRLLQDVAGRLEQLFRATDTVSRFGGDEFVVLLSTHDAKQALHAVSKIRSAFEPTFQIEGYALRIGASIGIATYPEHGNDVHSLIKRADVAMYAAKKSDDDFSFYDFTLDANIPNRLEMMTQLRHGIENNQLSLDYQPKVDLRTGVVYGVEALVRWHHPQLGALLPNDFISFAETSGHINTLTFWVIDKAIQQHHQWREQGIELVIAVNLSVRNLRDLEFPDKVAACLKAWNVAPNWLELEITESAMMSDPARAHSVLQQLDEMGVLLSIDDFGTGYSSLAYLKGLPVDAVKIDLSFVVDMMHDKNNAMIVKSTIDLGHNLGIKVVAEGVENEESWKMLRAQGCDGAQGFFICRPVPAEGLLTWFEKTKGRVAIDGPVRIPSDTLRVIK